MDTTSSPVLINGDRDEPCFYVRTYHGHPKQRNSHIRTFGHIIRVFAMETEHVLVARLAINEINRNVLTF